MWKSLISKDKFKFNQREKVGTIVNFFSEQFLNRDFEVLNLIPINHESYIKLYNLEKVFIDYNLFERNHPWRDFHINDIVDQLKKLNIDIYVINNTVNKSINIQGVTIINIENSSKEIKIENEIYKIPTMVNEKEFNIIGKTIKYDILIVSNESTIKDHYIIKLYKDKGFKVHNIILESDNRKKTELVLEAIKSSKILHLLPIGEFSELTIDYMEKFAFSMGTIVISLDQIISNHSDSYFFRDESSLVHFLSATLNNSALFDRALNKKRRDILLNNTFIKYTNLRNVLDSNIINSKAKVTLFLLTSSSSRIEEFINDLANQKHVDLQIIIITNNFELTTDEQDYLSKLSNLDIHFVYKQETESLGSVFSNNLKHVKYNFICKLTDDIKIFKNLILDLWLSYHYSDADVVGKKAEFIHLPQDNSTMIVNRTKQNMFVGSITSQMFFGEFDYINKILLPYAEENIDKQLLKKTNSNNGKIYCTDIYGYYVIYNTNKNANENDMSLEEIYEKCNFYSFGSPYETLLSIE